MKMYKTEVAKRQIETVIDLFLLDKDFVSALGLAGSADDILGMMLRRSEKKSMLENLHTWYQETIGEKISFGDFARNANFTRNTLKHANEAGENHVEVFRWETVQMLMRAIYNWMVLGEEPTAKMLEFNRWLQANKGAYETLE